MKFTKTAFNKVMTCLLAVLLISTAGIAHAQQVSIGSPNINITTGEKPPVAKSGAIIKKNTAPVDKNGFMGATPRMPLPPVGVQSQPVDKCSTRTVQKLQHPGRPGEVFGMGHEEETAFWDVAECRSQDFYVYFRRIFYIYSGFGVIGMVALAVAGRWQWKWLFGYVAGLFVFAAGQYIVEFLS